jgi:hypothetical protein
MNTKAVVVALVEAKGGGMDIITKLSRLHYDGWRFEPEARTALVAESIEAAKKILFALEAIQENE